jgi:opacity protein-like surface antigen
MKRTLVVLIGILLFSSLGFTGKVTKVGTTAAGFLSINVGAQAVSMGGAYVAVAEDATAMYWNPSGITSIEKFTAMFHHTRWIADVSLNYMGVVTPPLKGIGSFGVNITALTMDDMERTTVSDPEGTGEYFSAGSYAIGLCYARNLSDRFSIGFNVKYLNETIYNCSASGVAFDVGTLFTTQFNELKIGMSISNYGTKMRMKGKDLLTQVDIDPLTAGNNENINANLQTDGFDLPLLFRVGISMDVLKGIGNSNLILAADALHPNNDLESVNIGAEYILNGMYFIRGGYNSLFAKDSEMGLTLGVGLRYNLSNIDLLLDYAYQDFGILNNVQMFTLGIGF